MRLRFKLASDAFAGLHMNHRNSQSMYEWNKTWSFHSQRAEDS